MWWAFEGEGLQEYGRELEKDEQTAPSNAEQASVGGSSAVVIVSSTSPVDHAPGGAGLAVGLYRRVLGLTPKVSV